MKLIRDTKTIITENISDLALRHAYSSSEWRIIPLLFFLWMFAWVDRANIAFAKLQMLSDLHFSETVYGFGAGLFFLGYVALGVPTTMLGKRLGAKLAIPCITLGWGFTSVAMMFVKSAALFYLLRFLLGAFEAGFYPIVILYLQLWFPAKRRTRNFSIFHSGAILSTVVVGFSGGVVLEHMTGFMSLAGWKWMFLLQAAPTILLGCLAFFVLPNGPATASWLSAEQRRLIQDDLDIDGKREYVAESLERPMLTNPVVWILLATYFCILAANSALSFFIPTILSDAGFGDYAAIGNAIAAICILGALGNIAFATYVSRYNGIHKHCAAASFISVVSLLVLVFVWHDSRPATFLVLALALAGTGASISLFWQIPARYLNPTIVGIGIPFISSFGNLAGFLTPWLTGYVRDVSGSYASGFVAAACVQAIAVAILVMALPCVARKQEVI